MKYTLLLCLISYCFCLFAQPKPFDPIYYRDSLKVINPEEYKVLEQYRIKYKKLGYRNDYGLNGTDYPSYFSDLFFYKHIDLDKIDDYKETIIIPPIFNLPFDISSKYLTKIIVEARLLTFTRGSRYDDGTFEIVNVIRGGEFYDNFPDTIKCHSYEGPLSGYVEVDRTNGKITDYEVYFGKPGPTPGDKFIIYLDKNIKDEVFFQNEEINIDLYDNNVFYHAQGNYFDRGNAESKKQYYDDVIKNIKRIDELNFK